MPNPTTEFRRWLDHNRDACRKHGFCDTQVNRQSCLLEFFFQCLIRTFWHSLAIHKCNTLVYSLVYANVFECFGKGTWHGCRPNIVMQEYLRILGAECRRPHMRCHSEVARQRHSRSRQWRAKNLIKIASSTNQIGSTPAETATRLQQSWRRRRNEQRLGFIILKS